MTRHASSRRRNLLNSAPKSKGASWRRNRPNSASTEVLTDIIEEKSANLNTEVSIDEKSAKLRTEVGINEK